MLLSAACQAYTSPLLSELQQPSPVPAPLAPPEPLPNSSRLEPSPTPSPYVGLHRRATEDELLRPSPTAFHAGGEGKRLQSKRADDAPVWHNANEDPRIDAWCPGRCPPHRPINSDDIVARLESSGGNVTWESPYEEGSEPTRCDPCRHRWLFVASLGGRTGSTTLLDMLDQHPAVALSGENGGQLLTALTLWDQAARQDFTAGPWVRGKPNVANLICDLQSWFLDADPAKDYKGPDAIRGFKEVRFGPIDDNGLASLTDRRMPPGDGGEHSPHYHALKDAFHFLDAVFPCHRVIFSDRKEDFDLKWGDPSVKPRLREAWMPILEHDKSEGRSWHSYWIDLAEFTVAKYNNVLRWLGEPSDGCNFQELIHANANLDDNDYDNGTSYFGRQKCKLT